ncbi:hypothetical protein L6452_28536 [Arctium lappa]|uniref:Uncharacterized protein n=1 Tax=Arctium lappa TaxID=4217 RepID=A0ACB8ZYJ3_ARCLA|nr:hypothetical protein L6452_28536 [Arctium lappa]
MCDCIIVFETCCARNIFMIVFVYNSMGSLNIGCSFILELFPPFDYNLQITKLSISGLEVFFANDIPGDRLMLLDICNKLRLKTMLDRCSIDETA